MSYLELIKELAPEYRDVGYYLKQDLDAHITPESRLLDVGCGRQTYGIDYYKRAREWIGTDPDQSALDDNSDPLDQKLCYAVKDIPVELGPFDVVVAQWVLEHLSDPHRDIQRISDLLKTGGYFIFTTTNLNSPLVWGSKILPTGLKSRIRRANYNFEEEDTYPTRYRINTPRKIDRILAEHGLEKVSLRAIGVLSYFAFNRTVLQGKIAFDRALQNRPAFKRFSTHLVGVYKKI